ncbi:hypothetical protein POM88_048442 [Heracleum sosnowskyi]|uniref:BED-type domain-containing protein n=1 Tax=Heracleum sosnowskyi TaxID=360622 RepID=A0AAD8LZM6_9APIA|nr:hypothetical protein POM88_048442 [Heracleum sosnowskyi]
MDSKNKKKKKVQRIEVIPENAPYVEDSHITVGSFADESLSEEDIEQEELSQLSTKRKRVGNDVDSNEPEMKKDEPVPEKCDKLYQRKPRKKTSFVWKYMDTIKDANDVVKGSRCKLCSQDFMKSDSSSTSSMKRHLAKCLKAHGQLLQPQLQFQRGPGDEVQLSAFKYDHAVMREKVSHYVLITELPFLHVESFMWNEIMRTATPFYEKITRGTLKADCRKLKRVKELLDKKALDSNSYMREMASTMQEKFDKYWGESNLMISIGAVMDLRLKMKLINYCFHIIYPHEDQSGKQLAHLKGVLHDLYQEYVAEASRIKGITLESSQVSSSDNNIFMDDMETPACMSEYEAFIRDSGAAVEPAKSELDEYLFEGC